MAFVSWILVIASVVGLWIKVFRRPVLPKNAPNWWSGHDWPFLGATRFYTNRKDHFLDGLRSSSTGAFSFYIGRKHLIGLSGPAGRKVFYETRGLSLAAGSPDLITGHPSSSEDMDNFVKWFKKTFLVVMPKERTRKNVHLLTNDAQSLLQELLPEQSSWGVFDPFDTIYEIIYQLTIRMVGPTEIAQDAKLRAKSLSILESIEHSKSTMRVVFPWLPTIMHLRRTLRNIQLGMLLHGLIRKRQKSGIREDDTMQILLDMGTSMRNTIGFVIGALFAGQLNTGINAAWVLVKLAENEQWMARVRKEVDAVAARNRKYHGQPTTEALGSLTLDDWESEFPNICLCFHESIRLALTGSSFRKNISGQDIPIGNSGEVIPRDAYAAYLHDELHMNPDVYPNPTEFDPGRHLDERGEGKNVPHGYIGWGSGLHPCIGMKIAKTEMTIVLAYFIAIFDFELSDKHGNKINREPCQINRNAELAEKPRSHIHLRYRRRSE